MSRAGGSAALAAMLKARSDNGMTVLTEANYTEVQSNISPTLRAPRPSISGAPPTKCFICDKSVFKMEEIIAIGNVWHGSCFTCGGKNSDGCKRKLVRDGFTENKGQPYCKACYAKNFTVMRKRDPVETEKIARPISMMLLRRKKAVEDSKEEGNVFPAYTLAKKKDGEYVDSHVNAVLSPEASSVIPPNPSATGAVPSNPPFVSRALPPAPGGAPTPMMKRPSVIMTANNPKCGACAKSVYKMEEIIAIGQSWHSSCFTCGGTAGDGCKRKLVRDNFSEHKEQPYCKGCYDKLFKSWVKVNKAASTLTLESMLINKRASAKLIAKNIDTGDGPAAPTTPTRGSPSAVVDEENTAEGKAVAARIIASNTAAKEQNLYARPLPSAPTPHSTPVVTTEKTTTVESAPAPSAGPNASYIVGKTTKFNGANKCVKCTKTVYKMEEIIAVGAVWHNSCFTCGGMNSDGCNKTMTRDNYVDHRGQPYCNSCYNKQFRTKGFGYGNSLNTDYGVNTATATATAETEGK